MFQFRKAIRTQCQPGKSQLSDTRVLILQLALTERLVLDVVGSVGPVRVQVHPQSSTLFLFLSQKLRFGRCVGQKENGEDAEEYSNSSFDEEDEGPTFIVASVDFGETCSKKSTKCARPKQLAQPCDDSANS